MTCGLSDVYVLRGNPAEFTVKMNIDCDGSWFRDGEQVRPLNHHNYNMSTLFLFGVNWENTVRDFLHVQH